MGGVERVWNSVCAGLGVEPEVLLTVVGMIPGIQGVNGQIRPY
jgi:hypothetical protein